MNNSYRRPPVRKVNFPDTWPPDEVVRMYTHLKAAVDEAKKGKKEGRVKRVFMKREHEHIARQIFEKKRRVTFRNDTGSCEISPDSLYDLDQTEWKISSWFDASQMALKLLHPDYKRATAAKPEGQLGATNQPLGPQDSNRAHSRIASAPIKRAAPSSSTPAPAPPARRVVPHQVGGQPGVVGAAKHLSQASNATWQQRPQRNYIYQEPLFDPSAAAGERVAISQLTSAGVARLVELALRVPQPQAVYGNAHYRAGQRFVMEGLTGADLSQCTADDLKGVLNGPHCRRQRVVDAIHEFSQLGGIPRFLLQSWATVDASSPLPTPGQPGPPSVPAVVPVKPEPGAAAAAQVNG